MQVSFLIHVVFSFFQWFPLLCQKLFHFSKVSTRGGMDKEVVYINPVEYYSAVKKNENVAVCSLMGGFGGHCAMHLVVQSCLTLRPHGFWPARFLCPWDSPGTNTGVGCHSLLQGIFLTQGSNPSLLGFLNWQVGFLPLLATWEGILHEEDQE